MLYYNDFRQKIKDIKINGLPSRASVREILQDIIYSEFTDYEPKEFELDEERSYDYYFDLKDDTLGAFIARRQDKIDDRHLINIAKFLLGHGYLDAYELQIFRGVDELEMPNFPKIDHTDSLNRAPLTGEYVAQAECSEYIKLFSFKFSKQPRLNQIRVTQKDFNIPKLRHSINDNSILRRVANGEFKKFPLSFGVCILPKTGLVSIILFNEKFEVELYRIDVKATRNEFFEITRDKSEFRLLGNTDSKISTLFLEANKTIPRANSETYDIAYSHHRTFLDFSKKRPPIGNPLAPNEQLDLKDIEQSDNKNLSYNLEPEYKEQSKWDTQFIKAAENLDFLKLTEAMMNGANLETKTKESGNSALHWAAIHRSRELYAIVTNCKYMHSELLEQTLSSHFKLTEQHHSITEKWSRASGRPPIADFNNQGLLPSSCIPNIDLEANSNFGKYVRSLFLEILQIEYEYLGLKPEDFIATISTNSADIAFPNIIRFIQFQ